MAASSPPFGSIENKYLRLDYLTTSGPRIIGLHARGLEGNLLAQTPDVHWPTPHGEYYLRGGHRLWTAPEDPFYNCPEEGLSVSEENGMVTLSGTSDACGLEKKISVHLEDACVHLTHSITWHGTEPIELAPWAITQLPLGGMAILPQSASDGLQPDRSLVFWPYSQIRDERLELHDDLILIHACSAERAFKIGHLNRLGWIACTLGPALFVKRFPPDASHGHLDMGCNAEAYIKDAYIELETLGPVIRLGPNQAVTHQETWEIIVEREYPATPASAREIRARLSSS